MSALSPVSGQIGELLDFDVAETTDGGQTWTDTSPPGWDKHFAQGITCVSATDCWVVGFNWDPVGPNPQGETPWAANTTDGGATWTTSTNLPTITQYDPNGTYTLWTMSCPSALDCVAAGGLDVGDGVSQVISTTDGGDTWQLSTDPTLLGIQDIFGISCHASDTGLSVCSAAGADLRAAGPVEITSTDGGATWSEQTSTTTNEDGTVSCASVDFCVTTADNDVWFTTTGGGLEATASGPEGVAAKKPLTQPLPEITPGTVWARTGQSLTINGQYRETTPATTATVVIRWRPGDRDRADRS